MKLDETKLQEVVEKIAYQQFGQEQIDDLYAKMGMLNEYVQEQLRQHFVVGRSGQFCPNCYSRNIIAWGENADKCEDCELTWDV